MQSLGTTWGLFRHYWFIVKFVLTVVATGLLLLHMTLADRLADIAKRAAFFGSRWHGPRIHIMADAAAGIALLIVNTVLSVYKPPGMTTYGLRKQHENAIAISQAGHVPELKRTANAAQWVKVFVITASIVLIVFRLVLLRFSGGDGHHFH